MPFARFQELVNLLLEARKDEVKERMVEGAWIAFQMGAGGEMTFGAYLKKIGLVESQEREIVSEARVTAKEAIAKAEEILRMAREKQ